MSICWSYGTDASACSGAQYVHVPTFPPEMTCSPSSSSTAAPRSMSLTGESGDVDMRTTFSGFMSRWQMPHEWRW